MPSYLHPGVYVEEIPSGSKPIEGVGTSTAAFVGYTIQGPIGKPELIFKWDDYDKQYGGIRDTKSTNGDPMGFSVSAFFMNGGSAAYIVRLAKDAKNASGYMDHPSAANTADGLEFTAVNEGVWGNKMVVQITAKTGSATQFTVDIGWKNDKGELEVKESFDSVSMGRSDAQFIESVINGVSELVVVKLKPLGGIAIPPDYYLGSSSSADINADDVKLDLSAAGAAKGLTLALDGQAEFSITLEAVDYKGNLAALAADIENKVHASGSADRRTKFTCVVDAKTLILTSGSRVATSSVVVKKDTGLSPVLKLGSNNGAKEINGLAAVNAKVGDSEASLIGGADGSVPETSDYQSVFKKFIKYRDINIICLPGQNWPKDKSSNVEGQPVIDVAIAHAEKMESRMVIVDPPSAELETSKSVTDLGLPSQTYSVLYYPWVKVANPYYNAETNPGANRTVLVPPCGYAAGMWAKIDGKRGVWKAPAGLETGLLGVSGLKYVIEDGEQDQLNPLGVNCLRKMPGAGPVIWGARTLATKADPEWRYVPVRRTAIMIEQSIYDGIQWAVFEPNKHTLWSALRANIGGFMNGLFRSGAFQGEKASDAYFVRCGKGDTMTQADIDAGQVIVVVGFAPVKPAEFVIVRIQQKVNQQ